MSKYLIHKGQKYVRVDATIEDVDKYLPMAQKRFKKLVGEFNKITKEIENLEYEISKAGYYVNNFDNYTRKYYDFVRGFKSLKI